MGIDDKAGKRRPYVKGLATSAKQDDIITALGAIDLKETTDLEGNGIVSVGLTAVEIPFTGTTQSINIESVMGNSGTLYIGKSDVTNLGANALTSLQPGASVQMDFNDTTNALFVVSDTAAQSFIAGCLL